MLPTEKNQYDALGQFIGTSSQQVNGGTLYSGTLDGKAWQRFAPGTSGTTQAGQVSTPAVITAKDATKDLNAKQTELANIETGIATQNANRAATQAQKAAADQALATEQAKTADKTAADTNTKATKDTLGEIKTLLAQGGNQPSWDDWLKKNNKDSATANMELTAALTRINSGTANDTDKRNVDYALNVGWRPGAGAPADGSTKPGSSTFGDTNPDTGTSNTQTDYEKGIASIDQQLDDAHKNYLAQMENIKNGTFALTPSEQAEIDQTIATFNQLIEDQKTANKSYEAGLTQLGISAGRQRYAGEIETGTIFNAVNVGLRKIQDLEQKSLNAVNNLKQAFQDKNYKAVEAAYKDMSTFLSDKRKALTDMHKELLDEQKAQDQKHKDQLAEQTALLNQKKLSQELSGKTLANVAPSIAEALTGDPAKDEALINQMADYYGFDANAIRGSVANYQNKQKPDKQTTKTVKVGSGKTSQTYLITYDAKGKEIKREKMGGGTSSGGGSTTTKKVTRTQKTNQMEDKVNTYFTANKGSDNKVSPQDWGAAKDAWVKDGGNPTQFDSKFKGWRNPKNKNYQ